ncbi:hypothetical protein PanWU01x14_238440, partial [Parasponia andersonii]
FAINPTSNDVANPSTGDNVAISTMAPNLGLSKEADKRPAFYSPRHSPLTNQQQSNTSTKAQVMGSRPFPKEVDKLWHND